MFGTATSSTPPGRRCRRRGRSPAPGARRCSSECQKTIADQSPSTSVTSASRRSARRDVALEAQRLAAAVARARRAACRRRRPRRAPGPRGASRSIRPASRARVRRSSGVARRPRSAPTRAGSARRPRSSSASARPGIGGRGAAGRAARAAAEPRGRRRRADAPGAARHQRAGASAASASARWCSASIGRGNLDQAGWRASMTLPGDLLGREALAQPDSGACSRGLAAAPVSARNRRPARSSPASATLALTVTLALAGCGADGARAARRSSPRPIPGSARPSARTPRRLLYLLALRRDAAGWRSRRLRGSRTPSRTGPNGGGAVGPRRALLASGWRPRCCWCASSAYDLTLGRSGGGAGRSSACGRRPRRPRPRGAAPGRPVAAAARAPLRAGLVGRGRRARARRAAHPRTPGLPERRCRSCSGRWRPSVVVYLVSRRARAAPPRALGAAGGRGGRRCCCCSSWSTWSIVSPEDPTRARSTASSNRSPSSTTTSSLAPANQVLGGSAMLVDTASQYGVGLDLVRRRLVQARADRLRQLRACWTACSPRSTSSPRYLRAADGGCSRLLAAAALAVGVIALVLNRIYPVGALVQEGPLRFGLPMA